MLFVVREFILHMVYVMLVVLVMLMSLVLVLTFASHLCNVTYRNVCMFVIVSVVFMDILVAAVTMLVAVVMVMFVYTV